MTLQEENEMLREQVRQLKEALTVPDDLALATKFELSKTLATILQMLIKRPLLTRDAAMIALYGHYNEREVPDPKILDIFICKLRKKMEPHGVKIETDWGRGYHLTDKGKQIITDLLAKN